jgi:hypothetical protein
MTPDLAPKTPQALAEYLTMWTCLAPGPAQYMLAALSGRDWRSYATDDIGSWIARNLANAYRPELP